MKLYLILVLAGAAAAIVPLQPVEDCRETQLGQGYLGTVSKTDSGRTCQRWDSKTPQEPSYQKPSYFPDASIADAANYCRNPNGDANLLWCYTTDPEVRWEYCNIPLCSAYDPCAVDNPCKNGGSCTRDGKVGRKCLCAAGWTGAYCDQANACQADGTLVSLASWGYNDNSPHLTAKMAANGVDVSYTLTRGFIMAELNPSTCTLSNFHTYDICLTADNANAMAAYVNGLQTGTVVVGLTMDDAQYYMTQSAKDAMQTKLGVDITGLQFRGKAVFVAQAGQPTKAVSNVTAPGGSGLTLSARVKVTNWAEPQSVTITRA